MNTPATTWSAQRLLSALALCFFSLGLFAACAGPQEITRVPRERDYKAPCKDINGEERDHKGSLYASGYGNGDGLFLDMRAWKQCDVLTIKISERSSAAGSASTEVARQTEVEARIEAFLGILSKLEDLNGRIDSTNLVNAATDYTFKGSGSTRREGSLDASVTAFVRRVLPNGNLFVEGTKTILVNQEEQYFYISGVIRRIDIAPDNTIQSEMLADAQVEFTGTGVVSDATKQGWLGQFFTWIWPF